MFLARISQFNTSLSRRNKTHTTRVAISTSGDVLPAPYSYCGCEVGALGCAHAIALNFAAMHVQNSFRVWDLVNPDEPPLTSEEILGLFPPCIAVMQKTPCRAVYLTIRSRNKEGRGRINRGIVLDGIDGRAETDESSDSSEDETEDDVRPNQHVCLPLTKILSAFTFQMFNLDPTSLASGTANVDRLRRVSAAADDLEGMCPMSVCVYATSPTQSTPSV